VPEGEPFVMLTRELLSSDAWRLQGINTRRLIDALMTDHMNHAGQENGKLMATYVQLEKLGCWKSETRSAIEEAEFLGLMWSKRGGRWAGTNQPSIYRLTFLPTIGTQGVEPPTNEWKRITEQQIREWRKEKRERLQAKKRRKKNQLPG
jgi:hypothetical protein